MTGASLKRLAIYNFGIHVAPYDDPDVEGFRLREGPNFQAAERAFGFIGRSGYDGEPGPTSWGKQVFPRFLEGSGFTSAPSSLSLWADIESLMAFSYSGVHANALKHARRWNIPQSWPPLVLWWVEDGRTPEWKDGIERLEYLHDKGPGPSAFTLKAAFAADGSQTVVDRERVRRIMAENAPMQQELVAHVGSLKV